MGELQALQREKIRTVIGDPINNRRLDRLESRTEQTSKRRNAAPKANPARNFYAGVACTLNALCPYSGLRRNEANDLARMGEPE